MCDCAELAESDTYLNFCRLLGRLKANYQLAELVKMDAYAEWIGLLASFTASSFANFQVHTNSESRIRALSLVLFF